MTLPATTLCLIEALREVDTLNTWVRSESFQCGFETTGLRNVIYFFKSEAIKAAQRVGIAVHRLIGCDVKCRDCGGSGKYTDQYGYNHNRCRACRSTGTAHLQFIETSIADALIWHSPASWRVDFIQWTEMQEHPAGDWKPNHPGKDLSIDEAARLLNKVEAYFPARPRPRSVYDRDDYYGDVDDFATYRLNIGQTPTDACCLCSTTEALYDCWIGVNLHRLHWSARICQCCHTLHGLGIFKRCAVDVPGALFTPNVREWVRRRAA